MSTIYCFSSTGNSLYVANRIAETIKANVSPMVTREAICNDDVIGFVFPTFFWGFPKTVTDFITKLSITNRNAYIFAVITYGGYVTGVLGKLTKLLKEKGCVLAYGKTLKCVENYIPSYSVNDSPALQNKVETELEIITNEIVNRQLQKVGTYTVLNRLIYAFYPANSKNCDSNFTVEDSCSKCGMCQDICPRENIQVDNGKPVFKHDCELCLACLHICPAQAINWKNKTKGKERYINPHITPKELTSFHRGV